MKLTILLGICVSTIWATLDLKSLTIQWGEIYINNFNQFLSQYFNAYCASKSSEPYSNLSKCLLESIKEDKAQYLTEMICPFGELLRLCYDMLLANPECQNGTDIKKVRLFVDVYYLTMNGTCNSDEGLENLREFLNPKHVVCFNRISRFYRDCHKKYLERLVNKETSCQLYEDLVKCIQDNLDEMETCRPPVKPFVLIFKNHSKLIRNKYHKQCKHLTIEDKPPTTENPISRDGSLSEKPCLYNTAWGLLVIIIFWIKDSA